jgi:uncharacterized protein (DUF983 family)
MHHPIDHPHVSHAEPPGPPRLGRYLRRAVRLRCPECGISPMFVPARRVRSIWDWFTPLDGCPRCGYAYERESGYFLLATWAFNYGVVAGQGMIAALIVDHYFSPPLWKLIAVVAVPMPLFSFLFARHAKALYVAMDHYFDPHRRR